MRHGWRHRALVVLAVIAGLFSVTAQAGRIVAIGDLHGDFTAWRAIVRAAALIDANSKWTGGKTVLVQTGDVPDRGPDSLRIITDLMRLQGEAKRAGGKVYALVGNHEAMNMIDDLRYVSAGEYAAFVTPQSAKLRDKLFAANQASISAAYLKRDPAMTPAAIRAAWIAATPLGLIEHQTAWHPTGRIGRWVIGNPAVLLLDGTLFVHGGLSAASAALPIAEINKRVAAALKARDASPAAIINAEDGPLWYRGLAETNAPALVAELDQVLKAYGARRIVIAHTPNLGGIVISDDGRLVRIDTGISAAYGGKPSYLEIIDDKAVPYVVDRPPAGGTGK